MPAIGSTEGNRPGRIPRRGFTSHGGSVHHGGGPARGWAARARGEGHTRHCPNRTPGDECRSRDCAGTHILPARGRLRSVAPSVVVESRCGYGPPESAEKDTHVSVRTALLEMNVDRELALELTFGRLVADFVRKFRPPNPVAAQQGALRLATSLAVALSTSL